MSTVVTSQEQTLDELELAKPEQEATAATDTTTDTDKTPAADVTIAEPEKAEDSLASEEHTELDPGQCQAPDEPLTFDLMMDGLLDRFRQEQSVDTEEGTMLATREEIAHANRAIVERKQELADQRDKLAQAIMAEMDEELAAGKTTEEILQMAANGELRSLVASIPDLNAQIVALEAAENHTNQMLSSGESTFDIPREEAMQFAMAYEDRGKNLQGLAYIPNVDENFTPTAEAQAAFERLGEVDISDRVFSRYGDAVMSAAHIGDLSAIEDMSDTPEIQKQHAVAAISQIIEYSRQELNGELDAAFLHSMPRPGSPEFNRLIELAGDSGKIIANEDGTLEYEINHAGELKNSIDQAIADNPDMSVEDASMAGALSHYSGAFTSIAEAVTESPLFQAAANAYERTKQAARQALGWSTEPDTSNFNFTSTFNNNLSQEPLFSASSAIGSSGTTDGGFVSWGTESEGDVTSYLLGQTDGSRSSLPSAKVLEEIARFGNAELLKLAADGSIPAQYRAAALSIINEREAVADATISVQEDLSLDAVAALETAAAWEGKTVQDVVQEMFENPARLNDPHLVAALSAAIGPSKFRDTLIEASQLNRRTPSVA